MNKCTWKTDRRAFTLWELIITMGLFLLVAGLVISFITFMAKFTSNNAEQSERVAQLTDVRSEVDYWFSYYDTSEYEITVCDPIEDITQVDTDVLDQDGGVILAYAVQLFEDGSRGVFRYELRFLLVPDPSGESTFTQKLFCVYPVSAFRGTVTTVTQDNAEYEARVREISCSHIYSVQFYPYGDGTTYIAQDRQYLRYLIQLPVTRREFACVLIYG